MNAPSIPSHKSVYGYELSHFGDLIRSSGPEDVHEGTNKDSVGP